MTRTPFTWDNANFAWESNPFGTSQSKNPFTWDDVALIEGEELKLKVVIRKSILIVGFGKILLLVLPFCFCF